ncbi:MATE family efflux transporter [Bacillus suaedae]|uniref:MATE family efflux transporter n=1 Tax=Halalkalibacter suaedae TaxID=2822140 RepID=A0A940WVG4_9BACI|nr:MATE family efflux transporter [Bacillus suaedae]MBP3953150.1 MATE family efflux transporter [Bacillus suaedae]
MKDNLIYNLGASILTFLLTVFITFWMTPLIITNLGTEAYGFIPLTQQVISILSVLTFALSSVIARFLAISISKGNNRKAEEYFNTYLVSTLFGAIIIIVIIVILITKINKLIDVPEYLLTDVKLAIFFGGTLVIITFINSLFLAGPFAVNKLYITKGIEAINAVTKGAAILLLLTVLSPKIWYINLAAMIAGVISLLLSIFFFKKLIPVIAINFKRFNLNILKELLSSGIWNSIGQIGVILFLSVEIILANIIFGASKAGVYGAMLQLPLLLRTVANITSSVFAPVIIKNYASKNMEALINYCNKSVKLNGLLIALPASLICGFAGSILNIWLGPEFVAHKWLLILSCAYLIITLSPLPLNHIFTAVNKLMFPGLATIMLGVINLILAISLSVYTNLGLYGIVLAGAISLIAKNVIFIPIYSSLVTNQPLRKYFVGLLYPIIGASFVIILSIIIQFYFQVNNFWDLMLAGTIITIGYILFSFFLLFNKEEKSYLLNIYKLFKKKI